MEKFKQFWEWLSGKKSAIGSIAGTILVWAMAHNKIPPEYADLAAGLLTAWTGLSIAHKVVKAQ